MNPLLKNERLAREARLDPQRFAREYEAEFAEDLESFLPQAWIDAAVQPGRVDLPPQPGALRYVAAVDPSDGGSDTFALAIAHWQPGPPSPSAGQTGGPAGGSIATPAAAQGVLAAPSRRPARRFGVPVSPGAPAATGTVVVDLVRSSKTLRTFLQEFRAKLDELRKLPPGDRRDYAIAIAESQYGTEPLLTNLHTTGDPILATTNRELRLPSEPWPTGWTTPRHFAVAALAQAHATKPEVIQQRLTAAQRAWKIRIAWDEYARWLRDNPAALHDVDTLLVPSMESLSEAPFASVVDK